MAKNDESEERVEVKIARVAIDKSGQAVVLLVDTAGKSYLPIWIGYPEAWAIQLELENVVPPRPITHDLLANAIEALGGKVNYVSIVVLMDNTFYAEINLQAQDREINLDARPSDAIALALRSRAPVYVSKMLLREIEEEDLEEMEKLFFPRDEPIQ